MAKIKRMQISNGGRKVEVWSTRGYEGGIAINKDGALSTRYTYDRDIITQNGWLDVVASFVARHATTIAAVRS